MPLLLEKVCSLTARHSTLEGCSTDDFVAWIPHVPLSQGRKLFIDGRAELTDGPDGPMPGCGEGRLVNQAETHGRGTGLRRRSDKLLVQLWSVVMLQLAGQMRRAPKTRPLPDS